MADESLKAKEDYQTKDDNTEITPPPQVESDDYKPAGKLKGYNTIVTGADSGIGRAVAIAFAKEGANVALVDLEENEDLKSLRTRLNELGVKSLSLPGDVGIEKNVQEIVQAVVNEWGEIHTIVNNAAEQHPKETIGEISADQLLRTFQTNIFSQFYFVKAALPHLATGATIINTTSVNAYEGHGELLDYSSTKGAIVSFTRSLSQNAEILDKKIRVNAVAPGSIWTPIIPTTTGTSYEEHGQNVPMHRPGEAYELAPAYVYLASLDSSYVTGQTIHVNGGTVING